MTAPAFTWDPAGGRVAFAALSALLSRSAPLPARIVFSGEAAYSFAMQSAFAQRKCAILLGTGTAGPDEAAQALIDGATIPPSLLSPSKQGVTFGDPDNRAFAIQVVKMGPGATGYGLALHYLALERALREYARGGRETTAASDVDTLGEAGNVIPPPGDFGIPAFLSGALGWVGPLILIGVLGAAAIAAYAYFKTSTTIEATRANVAIETQKAILLAKTKLAADLAAQAAAAGQAVNIPDVVSSLGRAEAFESSAGWYVVGGIVASALAAIGYRYATSGRVIAPESHAA